MKCFDGVQAYLFITRPKAWWRYRTCDLQVAGSSPVSTSLRSGLMGKLLIHLCVSVTKQYNFFYWSKGGDALRLGK